MKSIINIEQENLNKKFKYNLLKYKLFQDDLHPLGNHFTYYPTYMKGYPTFYDKKGVFRWLDTGKKVISSNERSCNYCKQCSIIDKKTGADYDACLGKLPGVSNACCGHGSGNGYIQFKNGTIITLIKSHIQIGGSKYRWRLGEEEKTIDGIKI